MRDIAMIVNSDDMMDIAQRVVERTGDDIRIVLSHTYDETLQLAAELEASGCRLLIARGGHVRRLREAGFSFPIISIPFTGNNIASLLIQAKRDWGEFAVIGNPMLINIAQELESPIGATIHFYEITHWQDFEDKMAGIKAAGINAIVGGYDASRFARAKGLTAYCIKTNEAEISEALNEAKKVLNSMDKDKRWTDLFRSVLDAISEGVVLAGRNGEIAHINRPAKRLLSLKGEDAPDARLQDAYILSRLTHALATGESIYDELSEANDYQYTSTIIPVHTGEAIDEAVLILQEAEHTRKVEQKIRRRLAGKGLVARKTFSDIIGTSPAIKDAVCIAKKYADVNSTVLITGETGTGKEMFAQSIHNFSRRADEAFVAVNCATIPSNLLESELFGYVEGAFTGAKRGGKAGLFELAHNGTIFLDEIGETSLDMQARLLRALEERQIMRIGDDRLIPVNIRVIAATNKDLLKLVEEGSFRSDFYYRLNVLSLKLPPLRACKEDLAAMIRHFIVYYTRELGVPPLHMSTAGMEVFMRYSWPGNVRELKNIIERLTVTSAGETIDAARACEVLGMTAAQSAVELAGETQAQSLMNRKEYELIQNILAEVGGNKTEAAQRLGISRPTLHRKLRQMEALGYDR